MEQHWNIAIPWGISLAFGVVVPGIVKVLNYDDDENEEEDHHGADNNENHHDTQQQQQQHHDVFQTLFTTIQMARFELAIRQCKKVCVCVCVYYE